jgi:hypothetical protein
MKFTGSIIILLHANVCVDSKHVIEDENIIYENFNSVIQARVSCSIILEVSTC